MVFTLKGCIRFFYSVAGIIQKLTVHGLYFLLHLIPFDLGAVVDCAQNFTDPRNYCLPDTFWPSNHCRLTI